MPTKRLVGDSVPMLINGVSQQSEVLRLPSQVQEQINCLAHLSSGVSKRFPTEFIKVLQDEHFAVLTEDWSDAKIHIINRDEEEKYFVVMQDDSIRVFGIDGAVKTVTPTGTSSALLGSGSSYMNLNADDTFSSPKDAFRAHTIADTTFIVNRNTTTEMADDLSSTGPYKALVWIKADGGTATSTFSIHIQEEYADGAGDHTFSVNHMEGEAINLQEVAGKLAEKLNDDIISANLQARWRIGCTGNILFIENNTNDFTLKATHSYSDTFVAVIKDSVGGVGDLPRMGIPGMRVNVGGAAEDDDSSEGFWVKFVPDNVDQFSFNDDGFEEVVVADEAGSPEDAFTDAGSGVITINGHRFITRNTTAAKTSQGGWETVELVKGDFTITSSSGLFLDTAVNQVYFIDVLSEDTIKFNSNFDETGDISATYSVSGSYSTEHTKLVRLRLLPGKWVEDVKGGIKYKFKPETMPHVLLRDSSGDFRFMPAEGTLYDDKTGPKWGDREVGDEDTAGDPSFVDSTINDVFEWRESLGFASKQSLILSQRGVYTNFWPTTVSTSLDDSRIDVAASSNNVADFHYVAVLQDELIGFTLDGQYTLSSNGVLTSQSVSLSETTKYSSNPKAKPVNMGSALGFTSTRGGFSSIGEYFIREDQMAYIAESTRHIPTYIKGSVTQMSVSPVVDSLVVLTDDDSKTLYFYQWYWHGNEKVQSSWSKWTFAADIISADFFQDTLYLILQPQSTGPELYKMAIASGVVDSNASYKTSLDRRIDDIQCGTQTYDNVADTTTIVLPTDYVVRAASKVVVRAFDTPNTNKPGNVLTMTTDPLGTSSIVLQGDQRTHTHSDEDPTTLPYTPTVITSATADADMLASPSSTKFARVSGFYIGETYDSELEVSRPVAKAEEQATNLRARLQVMEYLLHHEDSAFYKVKVYPTPKTTTPYEYSVGSTLGESLVGSALLENGTAKIPIRANSTEMRMVVHNDTHIPHHIVSSEWSARFSPQIYRGS